MPVLLAQEGSVLWGHPYVHKLLIEHRRGGVIKGSEHGALVAKTLLVEQVEQNNLEPSNGELKSAIRRKEALHGGAGGVGVEQKGIGDESDFGEDDAGSDGLDGKRESAHEATEAGDSNSQEASERAEEREGAELARAANVCPLGGVFSEKKRESERWHPVDHERCCQPSEQLPAFVRPPNHCLQRPEVLATSVSTLASRS